MSTTELTTTPQQAHDTSTASLVLDEANLGRMYQLAEMMATARATVPKHLAGNKGDCMAVVMQAMQWRMNPFAVAQKTHLVNGTLGYEGQLVNAVVHTSGATKDRLNYEWFGDWSKVMGQFEDRESKKKVDEDTGKPLKYRVPTWTIKDEEGLGIRVWATMNGEAVPRVLELLLVQCRTRNSPLWADDPRQQIAYLAGKRWTRLHCPDVLLGVYTPDELEVPIVRDMGAAEVVDPPSPPSLSAEALQAWADAADQGSAAARKHWSKMSAADRALASEETKRSMWERATEADKRRTVDTADPKVATATAAADQATGEVDDEFVRSMRAAEKKQSTEAT